MATNEPPSSGASKAEPIPHGAIIGVTATYMALIACVVLSRMYTRFRIHQQLWWDDWTMVVGTAGTIGMCTLNLVMLQHGGDYAIDDVPDPELRVFQKLFNIYQMVGRLSILLVKVSILLLYMRLFFPIGVDQKGTFWRVIQVVLWMNVLYTVSLVLVLALQCVPSGRPWGSSCTNQWLVLVFASIVNIVSDLAVFLVPVASVWNLQMSRRKKWAVVSLFAFGTLAPLASIARLVYQIVTVDSRDVTVVYLMVGILANSEQVVGIIVGCLPVTSAWLIQLWRNVGTAKHGLHAASRRLRENWENITGSKGWKQCQHAGGRDPYQITDAPTWASQEMLYSTVGRERADESVTMKSLSSTV